MPATRRRHLTVVDHGARGRSPPVFIATLVLAVAIGLALVLSIVMIFEKKLIYFPDRYLEATPAELGLDFEELELSTSDGVRIHGWYLPAPGEAGRQAVLICHGNAGNVSHRLERAPHFQLRLGADVLLFDYRGYGRSSGRPDEEGTYRDARAAYQYLTGIRRMDPSRIILFGESLGAAVAMQLATEVPAKALVLEAPFTSIAEMAREVYPFLPSVVTSRVQTRYDNLGKVKAIEIPLLVVHGTSDAVVPLSHGRKLFEAAGEPKRFLAVEGAQHCDTHAVGGEAYWRAWMEILDQEPDR